MIAAAVVLGIAFAGVSFFWWKRDQVITASCRRATEGDFDGAVASLQAAIARSDPAGRRSEALGFLLYRSARWAEAAEAFREAWRVAPQQARHGVNLVLMLAKAGRAAEALDIVDQARQAHADDVTYVCAACLVEAELGHPEVASDWLRQAEALMVRVGKGQSAYGAGLIQECYERLRPPS